MRSKMSQAPGPHKVLLSPDPQRGQEWASSPSVLLLTLSHPLLGLLGWALLPVRILLVSEGQRSGQGSQECWHCAAPVQKKPHQT